MKNLLVAIGVSLVPLSGNAQITLVKDIRPGPSGSNPMWFTPFNGKLYFTANDSTHGFELWSYDGVNPPSMVSDLLPGKASSSAAAFDQHGVVLNNKLYLPFRDSLSEKLWEYDGVNFRKSRDNTGENGYHSPEDLCLLNDKIYFRANDGYRAELYSYDPSTDSTKRLSLSDFAYGYEPSGITAFQGNLIFCARGSQTLFAGELFLYNVITGSISSVASIFSSPVISSPHDFTIVNNIVYFIGTGDHGDELYKFDGVSPPVRCTDVMPGFTNGLSVNGKTLGAYNGKLYFAGAYGAENNFQLFEFDPATDSTRLIEDIGNGFSSMPIELTQYGSRLFFTAQNMAYGRQIWYYDGTTTAMYANLNSSISARDFTVWDNRLFMSMDVNDGAFGTELYCLRDPTNISDVTTEAFTVYPNPFQDGFQLKLISDKHAASYHLKICNIVGSLVCEKILDGNRVNATWISLGEYPPGLYVISVANSIGKCCFQKTLIKQ